MPLPVDAEGHTVNLVALTGATTPGASNVTEQGSATSGAASALAPAIAAGSAGTTNYLQGFSVDGLGATSAAVIDVTVTGLLGGTKTYKMNVVAGATLTITRLAVEFSRPVPASATATAITLNVPSFGAGNTQALAELHGFRLQVYSYAASLVRVVDADTARLDLDLGFGLWRRNESYRFARIDAPEMSTPEGVAARDALVLHLAGTSLLAQTSKADKYGRWLVELYADGHNVNDWLVSNGRAVYRTY